MNLSATDSTDLIDVPARASVRASVVPIYNQAAMARGWASVWERAL